MKDSYVYKTHAGNVCFPHSSISRQDQCNFHMTASWNLQLYKHAFDVLIQTQRRSFASTWSSSLEFFLPFLLLTAEAKLEFSIFIHLLYPLSFVPCSVTWLKPCTLSFFICQFMLDCSLTLHSPETVVFFIKHIWVALSKRGQFPTLKGFSPLALQVSFKMN